MYLGAGEKVQRNWCLQEHEKNTLQQKWYYKVVYYFFSLKYIYYIPWFSERKIWENLFMFAEKKPRPISSNCPCNAGNCEGSWTIMSLVKLRRVKTSMAALCGCWEWWRLEQLPSESQCLGGETQKNWRMFLFPAINIHEILWIVSVFDEQNYGIHHRDRELARKCRT